jgi:hypothetical protein
VCFIKCDLGLVWALLTVLSFHFMYSLSGLVWLLADVGLTVPPLYDKHAVEIPIIELECEMITITIRGYRLIVDRLRGASGGGGYLRRKWLMKRLWWLRVQRAATGQRRH